MNNPLPPAMRLLALDTSTEWLSVALYNDGTWSESDESAGQRHAELTLPSIDRLLQQAGVSLRDLSGIVYGEGPGSFTGLRIGCGVVQGLAFAADIPVLGVSTLLTMAETAGQSQVYACLDARAGEVYCAAYRRLDQGWVTEIAPTLAKPDVIPLPGGSEWYGVGNGFAAYEGVVARRLAEHLLGCDSRVMPSAGAMLRLALPQFRAGGGLPAHCCVPVYLRDKVAKTIQERQAC